ncbi:hypothetical protein LOCC1_G001043 [Lachnellula occidentalis]|uniref:Uncharacterized protein n=1 Tax=Lachnellula occidentalis TaxID=215460 RepID=A0A8H8S6U0_9HELO|nr:hypothetical protein LOCC1_G001043 [Lachnellula occidentalis]
MSSTTGTTSPIQHRDIRSAAQGFKRDKDSNTKWANGIRPGSGVSFKNLYSDELISGSDAQSEKVRPHKQSSQSSNVHKSHANKNPRPTSHASSTYVFGGASGRLDRKVDASLEVNDHTTYALSKSLFDLLPQHVNNTNTSIQIALRDVGGDAGAIYSFDNKASPGGSVALGNLVEQAEKKWMSEQTERIVKGEYEVLDGEGETTVLKGKKRSPKQKATKILAQDVIEDDGFELI